MNISQKTVVELLCLNLKEKSIMILSSSLALVAIISKITQEGCLFLDDQNL